MSIPNGNKDFPWHLGVFDAHCHPTDTLASLQSIPGMRANVLTVMATRAQDQTLVAQAADDYGISQRDVDDTEMDWSTVHKIVPAFGWHPWFSHQMFDDSEYNAVSRLSDAQKVMHYQAVLAPKSDDRDFLLSLPDPRSLRDFISQTRDYLSRYPSALVGEVGLDRSFRIPEAWLPNQADRRDDDLTPGGREGRKLSPHRVSMDHQKKVLLAQLNLAGEMQRAVSVHGVAAHGVVYETIAETWKGHERYVPSKREKKKAENAARAENERLDAGDESIEAGTGPKPYPPRICMHSFSGPADTVKHYIAPSVPCEVFFSFSTTINSWSEGGDGKVEAAVRAVPANRLLIESDLHTAGGNMDRYLQDAAISLCKVRGWELDYGLRQLGRNWKKFVFGR